MGATTTKTSPTSSPIKLTISSFSTSPTISEQSPPYTSSKLSGNEYHKLSNLALDNLTEYLEGIIEEVDVERLEQLAKESNQVAKRGGPASEWDCEYSSGVLNLRLGSHGTYVINKQPPNQQIWLSSPKSGPKRFDYDREHKVWFSNKEGEVVSLKELLDSELSVAFDSPVDVPLSGEEC
ncbi:Frataxin [Violaceomyces palustris]|uniref:Frataxin n=1 Tax=Violaceomyces palustris TaxID=1673888 RepID=A0ACD0NWE3_9BASI|nr:Frataxin [Violaceomyces palustris]